MRGFQIGASGEQIVKNVFANAGIKYVNHEGGNIVTHDFSIELNRNLYDVEVKFDLLEAKTGNIAIEYWNTRQDKPSGILATTSFFWVFVLQNPTTVWICRTEELKQFFEQEKCFRKIQSGGDGNSNMLLYKRNHILSIFRRIDDVENIRGLLSSMVEM